MTATNREAISLLKNSPDEYEPDLVEIHEAGHVVMAFAVRAPITVVFGKKGSYGQCGANMDNISTIDIVKFLLGGVVAQCIAGFDNDQEVGLAVVDEFIIKSLFSPAGISKDWSDQRIETTKRRCRCVVKRHLEANWPAIEAIARALRSEKEIEGSRATEILEEVESRGFHLRKKISRR